MCAKFRWQTGLLGLSLLGFQMPALGFDSASLEFSNGNRTHVLRLAGQTRSPTSFAPTATTKIDLSWEWSLAYWRGTRVDPETGSRNPLFDLGFGPDFRWISRSGRGFFGEGGLAIHTLSGNYGNNGRRLSTKLQFLTHLGVGYVFENAVFLSLRAEHVSNGSIKQPNDGVNFVGIRVGRPF